MQCLASNNNFEIAKIERGLTVEKTLTADLIVNQRNADEHLVQSIFLMVQRFCNLVNTGKNMNEDQQIQLAFDLFERFNTESLEDLMLFFKMARSGEFGDFYRLDSAVILSWVPKYLDKKAEARERETINERNARIRAENDDVAAHEMSEETAAKFDELQKRLNSIAKPNTAELNKSNPLFNYGAYLEELPELAKKMQDKELKIMLDNTSQRTHPEVYAILENEFEIRLAKFVHPDEPETD